MADIYEQLKTLPISAARIVELLHKERERREAELVRMHVSPVDNDGKGIQHIDDLLERFMGEITSDVLSVLKANGAMTRAQEAKANG